VLGNAGNVVDPLPSRTQTHTAEVAEEAPFVAPGWLLKPDAIVLDGGGLELLDQALAHNTSELSDLQKPCVLGHRSSQDKSLPMTTSHIVAC